MSEILTALSEELEEISASPSSPPETSRKDFLREQKVALFRVKKHPLVERVVVGKDKIIIVRTKDIKVGQVSLGHFEIMIDFFYNREVKILNVTRRRFIMSEENNYYDAPHIRNTEVCWGNLEDDIYTDLTNRDLYETVCDSISLLQASNKPDGYIRWEDFIENRIPMAKSFNFRSYLRTRPIMISPPPTPPGYMSFAQQRAAIYNVPRPLSVPSTEPVESTPLSTKEILKMFLSGINQKLKNFISKITHFFFPL